MQGAGGAFSELVVAGDLHKLCAFSPQTAQAAHEAAERASYTTQEAQDLYKKAARSAEVRLGRVICCP